MIRSRLFAAAGLAVALALGACHDVAHAAGVDVTFTARLNGSLKGSNSLGTPTFAFDQNAFASLAAGTGTGKADKVYSGTRTLAASASGDIDLNGGLTGPLGAAADFGHVKALWIHAAAANTNDYCVGGAGTNAFVGPFGSATDKICVKPGGVAMLVAAAGAGWPVTAATADLLHEANSGAGTSVSADVLIVGTSN